MISWKKGHIKSHTHIDFGDTRPHRVLLEIHPSHIFSRWCVIDLYLRTKTRIYSVKKNLFSKPSHAYHIFSALEEGYFFKIALETWLLAKLVILSFYYNENESNHLHNKNLIWKSFTHSRFFVSKLYSYFQEKNFLKYTAKKCCLGWLGIS